MISDWSGAALDCAFGLECPVLFIDIPRKMNNRDWQELRINPLEAHIRDEIGTIISVEDLSDAPALARIPPGRPERTRASYGL
jgi:hypothetical protein